MKTIGFLLFAAAFASADPIYLATGLGSLGGPSTGYAINSSGTVAGWSQNGSGAQQAFVSTPAGLHGLGSPASDSYAYGINNSGTVVGTTYQNGQVYGTIWSSSGATTLGPGTYAMAINNSGEVVGGDGQAFAIINGQLENLGNPAGVVWSAAYAVNDSGTVVGDGQLSNGSFRGIIWSPNGSMILIGTLGGASSQATAVNDNGEVVGFANVPSGYQHAFSMLDGLMIDLGTLGGGSSYAYGVNNSGEVVGYSYLSDGSQAAFLYDDGTMFNLNSLLPPDSGWDLLDAYAINDSGQITGVGLFDGQMTAFLLTDPPSGPAGIAAIPEPRELAILAAALALMILVRRWPHSRGIAGHR